MTLPLEDRVGRLEAIMGLANRDDTLPKAKAVLADVCLAYQVKMTDLTGPSRQMEFVLPRHLFCWLARQSGLTSIAVGRMLNRNHGTVLHACACVEDRLDTDAKFLGHVRRLASVHQITLPERYQP